MSAEVNKFDPDLMAANQEALAQNPYPGRGIVLGVNETGDRDVQAYWVMGRSENSRNRLLEEHRPGDVRTTAFDPSKVVDPSLIIYNALITVSVRNNTCHVVSNGDQTDTVAGRLVDDFSSEGGFTTTRPDSSFINALYGRTFEPDAPNYTPRITGMITDDSGYAWSIIRRDADGQPIRSFGTGSLEDTPSGAGICFHTYEGDGDPLPAFSGSPYGIALEADADSIADQLWQNLNQENRVALAVKTIDRQTGEIVVRIVNQLG